MPLKTCLKKSMKLKLLLLATEKWFTNRFQFIHKLYKDNISFRACTPQFYLSYAPCKNSETENVNFSTLAK